jgi:hypothetical protein
MNELSRNQKNVDILRVLLGERIENDFAEQIAGGIGERVAGAALASFFYLQRFRLRLLNSSDELFERRVAKRLRRH